jgi:hypothetical protein
MRNWHLFIYALKDINNGDKYFSKAEELGKDPVYRDYMDRLIEMQKKHYISKELT